MLKYPERSLNPFLNSATPSIPVAIALVKSPMARNALPIPA